MPNEPKDTKNTDGKKFQRDEEVRKHEEHVVGPAKGQPPRDERLSDLGDIITDPDNAFEVEAEQYIEAHQDPQEVFDRNISQYTTGKPN